MMGLFASLMDNAGRLTTSGLAVLGAFFLGALAIGAGVNLLTQALFRKRPPAALTRLVRVVGGLASGLAVGLLLFSGGGGWGWGTGTGSEGTGTEPAKTTLAPPAIEPPPPAVVRLGVTLLGGNRVRGAAFYLLDSESVPLTMEGLENRLSKVTRPTDAAPSLTVRIYEDSVAQDHPAVVALEAWAAKNQWRVSLEKMPGTLPVAEGVRP